MRSFRAWNRDHTGIGVVWSWWEYSMIRLHQRKQRTYCFVKTTIGGWSPALRRHRPAQAGTPTPVPNIADALQHDSQRCACCLVTLFKPKRHTKVVAEP